MRLSSLLERQVGDVFYHTAYRHLYHMTNPHGFAYTVDQNTLKALRQNYVSTTYDANKNDVYGYHAYDFKFVLNGPALVERYGGFKYDHQIRVESGKRSKYKSLDEREIGLATPEIHDFNTFLAGTVLLFDPITEKGIRWLLSDNSEYKAFFGPQFSEAPRAIEALYRHIVEWRKPIWIGREKQNPSPAQYAFLKDALRLHQRGGDFESGMRELSDKYMVKDHNGEVLDRFSVIRRQKAKQICQFLNNYYVDRPYEDVDVKKVEHLIDQAMMMLDLNSNIRNTIIHSLRDNNVLHPTTAVVNWTTVFRPLLNGDIDEALEVIKWLGEEQARQRHYYDTDHKTRQYRTHVGSMMHF